MFDFALARQHYDKLPTAYDRLLAIDTESTGLHFRHGAKPFMVAATYDDGESYIWQARVDPLTRLPRWNPSDVSEIKDLLAVPRTRLVMSNKKFDIRMLSLIDGLDIDQEEMLKRTDETIGMHHALNNLENHSLKYAAVKHAGIADLDESDLHNATRDAAKLVRGLGWALASKETCHVRKAPSKGWAVMDMWLPREVAYYMWEATPAYHMLFNHAHDEVCSHCGGKHWSPDCYYKAPKPVQLRYLKQAMKLDGWEWHPPEIHPTVKQFKSGLTQDERIEASFGNRPDLLTSTPDPAFGVGHPWYALCGIYCSYDTLRSVLLAKVFTKALIDCNLWGQYLESNINGLMSFIMENNGVSFNNRQAVVELDNYKIAAANATNAASYSISKIFKVNPDSPKQIQNILYGDGPACFGLPVERLTVNKKNRDLPGQPSTDKDVLSDWIGRTKPEDPAQLSPPRFTPEIDKAALYYKKLAQWHDSLKTQPDEKVARLFTFCCGILQYKNNHAAITQISNFLFNMLDEDQDGFSTLYQSINSYGAKTTRQSHSNPNGANISKGGKVKKIIEFMFRNKQTLRILFGPKPGREWWDVDYSQLQLVIFAFMAGDQEMIQAIINGQDLHDLTARRIYGLPLDPNHPDFERLAPTADQRLIAKGVNFGFLFGAQEKKLNLTGGVAGFYDILCDTLPSAVGFLDKMEWQVRNHGYVYTMGGYRLYVPETTPYAGSVYAIQGTEGEIVKRATYGCQYHLDTKVRKRRDIYITLPVHDALTFDAQLGYGQSRLPTLCSIMEDAALSYGVAAKVGCKYITTNWSEGIDVEFEE